MILLWQNSQAKKEEERLSLIVSALQDQVRATAKYCCYCFSVLCHNWWLTHWGRVTHICVSKLTSIGSDNGLSVRNKHQWNFNRNSYIFIQENRFECVVWKMAAILSRPQCVKMIAILQKNTFCCELFYHMIWIIDMFGKVINCWVIVTIGTNKGLCWFDNKQLLEFVMT